MKKLVKNLVLVALMLVFAAVAVADNKKAPKKAKAKRPGAKARKNNPADTDKDGKVSKEERAAYRKLMNEKRMAKVLKENPKADKNKEE